MSCVGSTFFTQHPSIACCRRLLNLPEPHYHHHRLILDSDGRKLSKSMGDTGLLELKAAGLSAADIRRLVGL